ncbi:MAG TPA: hypothetical protein VIJ18_05620 [Microbacteriaceae bacterium]
MNEPSVRTLNAFIVLVAATSITLFVLVVEQIFTGRFITDFNQDWLIAIHVPLAFVIFGGATLLPFQAIGIRRAAARTADAPAPVAA